MSTNLSLDKLYHDDIKELTVENNNRWNTFVTQCTYVFCSEAFKNKTSAYVIVQFPGTLSVEKLSNKNLSFFFNVLNLFSHMTTFHCKLSFVRVTKCSEFRQPVRMIYFDTLVTYLRTSLFSPFPRNIILTAI
jgi:hypothetical protein